MGNYKKLILSTLLILISVTSVAVNAQEKKPSAPKKSISILEALLSLLKSPENRLITRGDEVCPISPGNVGEQVIWSDRPLFIWQGKIPQSTINLYSSSANFNYEQDEQLFWSWSGTVPPDSQGIVYGGRQLQPEFIYDWEFIAFDKTYRTTFILMEQSQRDAIATELEVIENKLEANGATAEEIAIVKADYFVNKQLWSDALQQLYSVENPSVNLSDKKQEIETYLCESNNSNPHSAEPQ